MLSITIICIAGAIFVLSGALQLAYVAKQRKWSASKGELIRADIRNSIQNGHSTYFVAVEYSYIVGGKEFTGDRVSTDYAASSDRARHELIKKSIEAVHHLKVWYDPSNPSSSVLVGSTGVRARLPIFFGLILLSSVPAVYCFLSSLQESSTSNLDRIARLIHDNSVNNPARNSTIDTIDDNPPDMWRESSVDSRQPPAAE
jgi:hypothetical protein